MRKRCIADDLQQSSGAKTHTNGTFHPRDARERMESNI